MKWLPGVWTFENTQRAELLQEFHVYSNHKRRRRTPSGVPCAADKIVTFHPDGVSGPLLIITINIALLTESYKQPKWLLLKAQDCFA